MENNRIVFFGSGPVAAKSLQLLVADFDIEAVVTKPRPAHHKGDVPVIELAQKLKLPVLTATDKQSLDNLINKHGFESPAAILIDFGIIISKHVIDKFPLGIINSHFSLLPEWRGADPITFSILSGQKQTGVSLMLLVEKMDEGPILATSPYKLPPSITTPDLTEKLIEISYKTLCTVVPLYLRGEAHPIPQDVSVPPTYSRKLTKEDGKIDWTKPISKIEREIRAFAGWPKSRTKLGGVEVVITKAHAIPASSEAPGTIEIDEGLSTLMINAIDGYLCIDSLTPAGKKEMPVKAFLNGYRDKIGTQAT